MIKLKDSEKIYNEIKNLLKNAADKKLQEIINREKIESKEDINILMYDLIKLGMCNLKKPIPYQEIIDWEEFFDIYEQL